MGEVKVKESQLGQLRRLTTVDCDTLDARVPQSLGPFEDCTANQAIALAELSKPENEHVIVHAVSQAKTLASQHEGVSLGDLAVEVATVQLALRILPHIHGHVHMQTNPVDAYSTLRTSAAAMRMLSIARQLQPSVDTSRIMIKVPSTWEGLQACRQLKAKGIKTLATTLFSLEQAVAAAEAGCHYCAPYLHDLRFVTQYPRFHEEQPVQLAMRNALIIQSYFNRHGYGTRVITAALMSPEECFTNANCRMTVSPSVLQRLEQHDAAADHASRIEVTQDDLLAQVADSRHATSHSYPQADRHTQPDKLTYIDREGAFRTAFARRDKGLSESKQIFAINEFCEAQSALRKLIERHMQTAT
ncbi:MAG: hypothetical protein Q9162_003437 [Coniocarpon cinnabarinum]